MFLIASEAQAQGAQMPMATGFGAGNPAQQGQAKAPQYVPNAKAQEKIFPLGETWTAVSLNGKRFQGGDRPSFIIDSQYPAPAASVAATPSPPLPSRCASSIRGRAARPDQKPCDKGAGAVEQAFLVALRTAAQWDIVGSQLVLKSPSGEIAVQTGAL